MEKNDIIKPCFVQTREGFSVSYKNKFLYSKYSPSKTILNLIEQTSVLPGTIILCFSPVLSYGIKELSSKLPENCLIVLCEAESDLYDFAKENNEFFGNDLLIPSPQELKNLPIILYDLNKTGKYKRVIRIDFSAGVQFHQSFYDELFCACSSSIMTFWKNRITLTKFGRQYSKNLFCNLKHLGDSTPITQFFHKIERPIIIFGSGQSVDLFFSHQENIQIIKNYFILCADTALHPLLKRNIIPNGVFIEEAQFIISKAFINIPEKVHIFAGLSSLPQIAHNHPIKNISYFTTQYANTTFLFNLQKKSFCPPVNSPFGSVGLTAVHYALLFRKNHDIPVFVVGLDFSYSAGITHAKNALAHITRLFSSHRLQPIQNYAASFNNTTSKFLDKQNNVFYTTPTLQTYATTFNHIFGKTKNLFDAGECGIPLEIERENPPFIITENPEKYEQIELQKKEIQQFLQNEKDELLYLKKILTGEIKLNEQERKAQIIKIATSKEYLYLHFADGYNFTYSQSLLNRIRTEIDYFLKWITSPQF